MWRFWQDVKSHRALSFSLFLLWLGAWLLSLAPHGIARPDPFVTHFALAPFVAAFLAAWWQREAGGSAFLPMVAPAAGLLVALTGWLIAYTRLLLEVISRSSQPELFSPGWAVPMFLSGAVVMGIAGLVAGSLGGLASSLLAAATSRLRQRGRPSQRAA